MNTFETDGGNRHSINVQKELTQAEQAWQDVNEHYKDYPDGPEKIRLLELHSAAMQKLDRAHLLQESDLPGSFEESIQEIEDCAELYLEANELRATMTGMKTRELSGAEATEDTDAALSREADAAEFPAALQAKIARLNTNISADPTEEFAGRSGYFVRNSKGGLSVDMSMLRKAEAEIDKMMPLTSSNEQRVYLENLKAMHQQLEQVSPYQRSNIDMGMQPNSFPPGLGKGLQILAISAAAFYATISFVSQNYKTSFVSAIAVYLLLNPDFIKGKSDKSIRECSFIAERKTRGILEHNLTQPGSTAAVQEVYDRLDRGGPDGKGLRTLMGQREITDGQLDQYLGSESTPLKEVLLNINPSERARTVYLISRAKMKESREILLHVVKNEFEQVQSEEDLQAEG